MRLRLVFLLALVFFHGRSAEAQSTAETAPLSPQCAKLNQEVMERVAQGRSEEVERLLSVRLANLDGTDPVCAGLVANNLAARLLISGRLADAERMALRSVRAFEQAFPSDDPVLLRPLQILAASRFEQGEIGEARKAFRRMQAIQTTRPQDRWLVQSMAGTLLATVGKLPEAESEFATALETLQQCGLGQSSDAGTLLADLSTIYIRENRMPEALRFLDQASAVFAYAADADPWDRIKLLRTRGALHGREGQWKEAEQDLADALALADRESRVEPAALRYVLRDYATVLQKNHKRREAQSIKRRLASLGGTSQGSGTVDVSDLLGRSKAR